MFKPRLSKKRLRVFILIFSLVLGISAFIFGKQIENLQDLGYLGVFIANLVGSATIFLPVPALATTVAVGAFLNPILTGVFSAVGSTMGELTGYYAGVGGGEFIKKDKKVEKVKKWMKTGGLWVVFALAVLPNPLFDLTGVISGASGISVWRYLVAVFSGKLIKFITLSYAGFGILKIFQ